MDYSKSIVYFSHEATSVFEDLIDAETGDKIAQNLVNLTLTNSKIDTLHIIGKPASGKSTIIGQFIKVTKDTARYRRLPVDIRTTFFDKVQAQSEDYIKQNNQLKPNSRYWDRADWKRFEIFLASAIINPHMYKPSDALKIFKKVSTVETPYILYWEKDDNGRKIFENISKRSQGTVYVYVVSDFEIASSTLHMRAAIVGELGIASLPAYGLVRRVREIFNTVLVGYNNSAGDGKKVRQIVRRMAPREAVLRIRQKTDEIIAIWAKDAKIYKKYMNQVKLPDMYSGLSKREQDKYRQEAAYILYVFREEIGLPKSRSKVVFNLNRPGRKVYMYLKMLGN